MKGVITRIDTQQQAIFNGFYKSACVGLDATRSILPKVRNAQLQTELLGKLEYYREQKQKVRGQMLEFGAVPQERGSLAQFCANLSVQIHCFSGASTSEIAKLMLKGTGEGVIQITQLLHEHAELPDALKSQGEGIVRHEEHYTKRLREYL